jgi:multimeric flavodoxin WrbA
MKLLGLGCGVKMGNSEILLKEALMGAEELGADVEILRMLDLNIEPLMQMRMGGPPMGGPPMGGPGVSAPKDDAAFFREKVMECDGLIISAPVYSLTPPGYLISIRDRILSPFMDMAGALMRKKAGGTLDERALKMRAGALISVGGATTPNWVSFGLALLHSAVFAPQIVIVDQMQVLGAASPGAVVLDEEAIKRARRVGRHVGEAMGKLSGKSWGVDMLDNVAKESIHRLEWMGDEPGTCPVCHTDIMMVGKNSPIECALCGIKGDIKVVRGKITVVFSEEEQKKSRLTIEGKRLHQIEIQNVSKAFAPRRAEVPKKLEKYKSYKSYLRPPSKAREEKI